MVLVFLALCIFAAFVLHPMYIITTALFVRKLQQPPPTNENAVWPRVSVLVCVRGVDPSLLRTLERLMRQDYPDYELRVVVDSTQDHAWPQVQALARSSGVKIDVQPLRQRLRTCSLKCSALVQMIDELDPRSEVIALCDSDLDIGEDWLRKLVAPLADPQIGAVTGIRWFRPRRGQFGSNLRKLWVNLSTIWQAITNSPWGGSLAIRRSAFEQADLAQLWRQSIVDDTPVRMALAQLGLRVYATPALIVPSSEECTLPFAFNFVSRQLMWLRLYDPIWSVIQLHALDTLGAAAVPAVMAVVAFLVGDLELAAITGSLFVLYLLTIGVCVRVIDAVVDNRLAARELPPNGDSWLRAVREAAALLALPFFHVATVVNTSSRQQIDWRGVKYLIHSPTQIELIEDRPWQLETSEHSI
ncbi:MAG: glycosyltransferase [Planctomycetaceae bacterium]|nr:glycosyltransferase [Planctomycetaceae bacterium]